MQQVYKMQPPKEKETVEEVVEEVPTEEVVEVVEDVPVEEPKEKSAKVANSILAKIISGK